MFLFFYGFIVDKMEEKIGDILRGLIPVPPVIITEEELKISAVQKRLTDIIPKSSYILS